MPGFVPVVSILRPYTWVWRRADCRAIVVKLQEVLFNPEVLNNRMVRDLLDFDGLILLSMVMPDEETFKLKAGDLIEITR